MLPIGPLMMEHRLIERMIAVIEDELEKIQENKEINALFIDKAADFIRTYADQTHHGKEEDILFRELEKKEISEDHKKTMNELIEEHKFARKTTGELVTAKDKYLEGEEDKINTVINAMQKLVEFYPKHIEKEDEHFFIPVMEYFTDEEKAALLKEGQIFDRRMIHRRYKDFVLKIIKNRDLSIEKLKNDWVEFF
ncbi:MAG: hemerythrin domain-containing protein [Promethearchaeia archaeon]